MKWIALAAAVSLSAFAAPPKPPFNVVEATIPEMQQALKDGRVTSRQLVEQSLIRIGMYEDKLHAAITVNPDALKEADAARPRARAGRLADRLHGIPIALKDNITDDEHADHRRRARLRRARASLRGHAHQESSRRPAPSSSPRPA